MMLTIQTDRTLVRAHAERTRYILQTTAAYERLQQLL